MAKTERHCVFFLDDDSELRKVVWRILSEMGIEISCFSDPATCIANLRSRQCNLLITDLKMPEMDGVHVLREVKRLVPWVPVLVVSGYGDIPAAVSAIKSGAADFMEKPLDKTGFVQKISSLLSETGLSDSHVGSPLTQAEITILRLVIEGRSSKEIAGLLHRSRRTIEWHRSQLMRKLHAENLLDLARHALSMGLVGAKTESRLAATT